MLPEFYGESASLCKEELTHIFSAFKSYCERNYRTEHYLVHKIGEAHSVAFLYIPKSTTGFYSMGYNTKTGKRAYTMDSNDAKFLQNIERNLRLVNTIDTACRFSEVSKNDAIKEDLHLFAESFDKTIKSSEPEL